MNRGILRHVYHDKGFTFVRPDDGSIDIFLHASGLAKHDDFNRLVQGMAVEYEIGRQAQTGRPIAINARPLASHAVALAMTLAALVEERFPRGEVTAVQTLRLGTTKLIEEALEAACCVALPREMSEDIDALSDGARVYFRNREWLSYDWTRERPSDNALKALRSELVDNYIVIAHLSRVLVEISGEELDLEAEALQKATADLARPRTEVQA